MADHMKGKVMPMVHAKASQAKGAAVNKSYSSHAKLAGSAPKGKKGL